MNYRLIDSGDQQRLEQFGPYRIIRPAAQAIWPPKAPRKEWGESQALFTREGGNRWQAKTPLPQSWTVQYEDLLFKVAPTDFGHVGLFPEHGLLWNWAKAQIQEHQGVSILNLFAYSGGATLALAKAGATLCHLDASKKMVDWARQNAALNQLEGAPIRWIVEDVIKFLEREIKRGRRYDAIIMDPPSFGRGAEGEVFKLERDLIRIIQLSTALLSDRPLFMILSCHTPGITPRALEHLLQDVKEKKGGRLESGELVLPARSGRDLPSGIFARWSCHG